MPMHFVSFIPDTLWDISDRGICDLYLILVITFNKYTNNLIHQI